jgi:hypothetical protein
MSVCRDGRCEELGRGNKNFRPEHIEFIREQFSAGLPEPEERKYDDASTSATIF